MGSTTRVVCTRVGLLMLVVAILMSSVSSVAATSVVIENESVTVGQILDVHCWNNDGKDFGVQQVAPFNHISWTFTGWLFGRDIMTCTFATAGKPTTTIEVYKGYGFNEKPCTCNGGADTCFWQALNEGFWCNHNFVQNWG